MSESCCSNVAMTHDVGNFISLVEHHKHSYDIIRNWDLLGFDDEEVEIIATAAMCHRKQSPRRIRPVRLRESALRLTEVLASVVSVADALDRSQLEVVREVVCRPQSGGKRIAFAGLRIRGLSARNVVA